MNKHLGDNPLEKKRTATVEKPPAETAQSESSSTRSLEDSVYARLRQDEASYRQLLAEYNTDESTLLLTLENLKKQGKIEELDLQTYFYPNMFRLYRCKSE